MKRSNREVNIFNMSLLDILCGALGAFCFMMLSLLPYYRPPDQNFNVSEQQKKLLDEVQKIKDLAEKLKDANNVEDLRKLVEELKKQIALLEDEIKQLQGQVNSLLAENGELKRRVAKLDEENKRLLVRNDQLEKENQRLRARNDQLEKENQQLQAQNQQLEKEKQQLEQQKRQLENRLREKLPWSVTVISNDSRLLLDCSLHEQAVVASDGSRQPGFDPELVVQPTNWNGDFRLAALGTVTRVNASRFGGGESKFYIKVNSPHSIQRAPGAQVVPLVLSTGVDGTNLAPVRVPDVSLPRERSWVYVGRFRVEDFNKITFTEATQAERDAEWERLTKTQVPKSDSELTDAVMGPGFEKRKKEYEASAGPNPPEPVRMALLQKWLAEAQSPKERTYVTSLLDKKPGAPGVESADALKRKVTYTRMLGQAQSQDEKITIMRRWMTEADSDRERDYVRMILQRIQEIPGSGRGDRPGLSNRMRGMEELQKPGPNSPPSPAPAPAPSLPPPPPPPPKP